MSQMPSNKPAPHKIRKGRAVDDEDPNKPFNPAPEDPHPSDEEHYDQIPHPGGAPDVPDKNGRRQQ